MSTPHARNIVRKLLAANKSMRIQDLYTRGLSEYPATPFPPPPPPKRYPGKGGKLKAAPPPPPNPGHPFRSHSYLKDKVLPELVSAGEVKKFHEVVVPTPGTAISKKRVTKSKEDEPTPESHDWHLPNQLFSPIAEAKKRNTREDPYGSGRLDHLNTRRGNARPEKLRREKEWAKSIELARAEGGSECRDPVNVSQD
ncbi:hypothetical protein OPQ81_006668 [Rhizoctonia solani]|nr:hypothetical protein OPQ81_006668 [Rhizoctonia solani]